MSRTLLEHGIMIPTISTTCVKVFTSPQSGTWEVHVVGSNVPTGPQKFAISLSEDWALTNTTQDADLDGVEDDDDDCPNTFGTSTIDRLGCPDTDKLMATPIRMSIRVLLTEQMLSQQMLPNGLTKTLTDMEIMQQVTTLTVVQQFQETQPLTDLDASILMAMASVIQMLVGLQATELMPVIRYLGRVTSIDLDAQMMVTEQVTLTH